VEGLHLADMPYTSKKYWSQLANHEKFALTCTLVGDLQQAQQATAALAGDDDQLLDMPSITLPARPTERAKQERRKDRQSIESRATPFPR